MLLNFCTGSGQLAVVRAICVETIAIIMKRGWLENGEEDRVQFFGVSNNHLAVSYNHLAVSDHLGVSDHHRQIKQAVLSHAQQI
jgi:hypothetical protein